MAEQKNKKNNNEKTDNANTVSNLKGRNKTKINKLTNNAQKKVSNTNVEKKETTRKTQGMANKILNANFKKIQKQKITNQNNDEFNLKHLIGDKASKESSNVEGIIKNTEIVVKSAEKNNATDIKANVIGKKSDVIIIGSKLLLVLSIVLATVLLLSLVSNYMLYSYFKFKSQNPLVTISKPISLELKENQTNFSSITIPRQILPNSKVEQEIDLFTLVLDEPIVVRLKAMFTSGDGEALQINLGTTSDWVIGNDGYYYFNLPLLTGQTAESITSVTIPNDFELEINGKNLHVITFCFETLSYNYSLVTSVWTSASLTWLTEVFNL